MIAQRGFIAPAPDETSRAWWDGLAAGRIVVPRCRACGRRWFPPGPACPACGARDFEHVEAPPEGTVYSWIVVHRALDPAFAGDEPYAIATVDLDGGPRVLGRLALDGEDEDDAESEGDGAAPAIGARVEAVFYSVEGRPLLGFRPVDRR